MIRITIVIILTRITIFIIILIKFTLLISTLIRIRLGEEFTGPTLLQPNLWASSESCEFIVTEHLYYIWIWSLTKIAILITILILLKFSGGDEEVVQRWVQTHCSAGLVKRACVLVTLKDADWQGGTHLMTEDKDGKSPLEICKRCTYVEVQNVEVDTGLRK